MRPKPELLRLQTVSFRTSKEDEDIVMSPSPEVSSSASAEALARRPCTALVRPSGKPKRSSKARVQRSERLLLAPAPCPKLQRSSSHEALPLCSPEKDRETCPCSTACDDTCLSQLDSSRSTFVRGFLPCMAETSAQVFEIQNVFVLS